MSPRILYSSKSMHWPTPDKLRQELQREFRFDLDPCPLNGSGGLDLSWKGKRVFCNPPYGPAIADWLKKASEAAIAVFLLPARTDTIWFHEIVLPKAREVRFIKGRLRFGDGSGRAPFPSVLIVFRKQRAA